MKSVGIITFHWAANYGAVLQTWALQEYIQSCGLRAEIIDYVPRNLRITLGRCLRTRRISKMKVYYDEYRKNKMLTVFRGKYLKLSDHHYGDKQELKENPPVYDCYISGSDQIWNPYFTMNGQKGVTLSYFLDFAPDGKKRISFSSSFGVPTLPSEMAQHIQPELEKYSSISTREEEGVHYLKSIGFQAMLTSDPTILLNAADYIRHFSLQKKTQSSSDLFLYCLHGHRKCVIGTVKYYAKKHGLVICEDSRKGVNSWLEHILNSQMIVTNSFHCMVFCIMFHKPFVAFEAISKGPSMGGRMRTLLGRTGLLEFFCSAEELQSTLDAVEKKNVNWDAVDKAIQTIQRSAQEYLKKELELTSI